MAALHTRKKWNESSKTNLGGQNSSNNHGSIYISTWNFSLFITCCWHKQI